jgi:hypothetical protein
MRHNWDGVSADKCGNERLLLDGLDSLSAVVGSDPGNGVVGRTSTHDGKASQGRPGPSMAAETTQLHSVPVTSTFEKLPQSGGYLRGIFGHSKVWPVEKIVAPRRFPSRIQIETVVRRLISGIGVPGIERHSRDLCAVRQDDDRKMLMKDELQVIVVGISALGWLIVLVPVDLALRACHHRTGVGHPFILTKARRCGVRDP